MKPKIIIPAYRRNIRKACAALGNRVPNGYQTTIATNGDFIVYNGHMNIVGRLSSFEEFRK